MFLELHSNTSNLLGFRDISLQTSHASEWHFDIVLLPKGYATALHFDILEVCKTIALQNLKLKEPTKSPWLITP